MAELRAQGRYGPELRDVLPGFIGLTLSVLAPVLLLAWLNRALGVIGVTLGCVLLVAVGTACLLLHRTVVRRRGGRYTPAELARLDDQGLALAAARMLRRDGWCVVDLSLRGRPRLYAQDCTGRELDVAIRPVTDVTNENEGVSRPAAIVRQAVSPDADHLLRVIVYLGTFSREDVLWASSHGGTHLVDGLQLQRWADGASLDDLGLPSGLR
ncbi:hypothetical protein AB0N62_35560 [Streptomyces sp. NPDC093982]|uniref:hypothetical protein n=1 Tax=Streptomyces sp. NPDC093982 TaxID=3155077 RepID=UPI003425A5D6